MRRSIGILSLAIVTAVLWPLAASGQSGPSEAECAAPGVSVESTWKDGTYRYLSGTSMATPHVSGLAAKLWQGDAQSTRNYLQGPYVVRDIWDVGDVRATGFGLPQVP